MAAFDPYTLNSAIVFITELLYFDTFIEFWTTDGDLYFSGGDESTFQAITTGVAVSPEPSSFLLLATGLLSGAGVLARRFS